MKKKALFLIPCCQKKEPGGNYSVWGEIYPREILNKFSFLDRPRNQLLNFYSTLSEEMAFEVYKNRGNIKDKGKKVLHAWQKNLDIYKSETMMAIDRYNGHLYRSLDRELAGMIRTNEIDNVIIVSALLGLMAPTDFIPDYELMMTDKAPGNVRVWEYWAEKFRKKEMKIETNFIFSKFDYIFCLLSTSTGYVNAIAELLNDYDSYILKSQKNSQAEILRGWAGILNDSILSHINCPDEVERVARMHNCDLTKLKSFKNENGKHFELDSLEEE